jgi:TonB family protein
MPSYPEADARARNEGLAVADLEVDSDGFVISVTVLQSPSPAITHEVLKAAKASRFKLPNAGVPVKRGRGKLYYYFRCSPGGCHVFQPTDLSKK